MKICLYLEMYRVFGGRFDKNIGTGLLSSYRNQKKSSRAEGSNPRKPGTSPATSSRSDSVAQLAPADP